MIPGGQLRDHSPVFRMQPDLAVQGIAQQTTLTILDSDPGFITGSLNAKHNHELYGKPRRLLHKVIFCLFLQTCIECAARLTVLY